MGKYLTYGLLLFLLISTPDILAQKPLPDVNVASKVEGLELPPVILANSDGFTTVQAKSKGSVKWLVISNKPVKYMEDAEKNMIILGSVPEDADINIFAVANIDGKLTEFASTKVGKGKNAFSKQETDAEKLDYKIRWH
jgi:hypothetical protein